MRKVILMAAVAVMVAMGANAQQQQPTELPHTETTQSVSVDINIPMLAGIHHAHEFPLARRATLIGRIGVQSFGFRDFNLFGGKSSFWYIIPSIDIEPRFYYGLDRRKAHGRNTAGNAGSFFALQAKNFMPFGYISESDARVDAGLTALTPMWGMRRVWNEHWLFEFTAGYSFAWGWKGDYLHAPHLGVRFGYSFEPHPHILLHGNAGT
jgi:hypothetical protein